MENNKQSDNDQELTSLFKFLSLVWQDRKLLLLINSVILILAIIISLALPKWYRSDAKIYLEPEKNDSYALMQMMQGIPLDLLGGSSNSLIDLNISIVNSRLFKDQLIEKFNLDSIYDTKYREDTYKAMSDDIRIIDNEDGTFLLIGLYKESPQKAKEFVDYAVKILKNINIDISQKGAQKYREFIQSSYNRSKNDLYILEDSLKRYQENYGILDIKDQTTVVIEQLAELEAQKIRLELQLEFAENNFKGKNQEIESTKSQLKLLQNKIIEFKSTNKYSNLAYNNIPDLGLKYLRLYRDVLVNQKILEILRPQLEKAKIDEYKNIANLLVIDEPRVPDKKYKPTRSLIVLFSCFFGFWLSILSVYFKNYYKSNTKLLKSIFH